MIIVTDRNGKKNYLACSHTALPNGNTVIGYIDNVEDLPETSDEFGSFEPSGSGMLQLIIIIGCLIVAALLN